MCRGILPSTRSKQARGEKAQINRRHRRTQNMVLSSHDWNADPDDHDQLPGYRAGRIRPEHRDDRDGEQDEREGQLDVGQAHEEVVHLAAEVAGDEADGHAERRAALKLVNRQSPGSTRRLTLGADKRYDSAMFRL